MLKHDRFDIILEELNKSGSVSFGPLALRIAVSEDTIRRDIKELDNKNLLQAVRGGAIAISRIPHHYRDREHTDIEQKKVIAKKALRLIKEGQVLFFDGGTSVLELAKILPVDMRVTVVTNSFPVANVLEDHPSADLIFLGGRLSKSAFATFGYETLSNVSKFKADLYFFGVCSITLEDLSCIELEDAEVKKLMVHHSKQTVGLCTTDKLNSQSSYYIEKTDRLSILITEIDPENSILRPFSTSKIVIM